MAETLTASRTYQTTGGVDTAVDQVTVTGNTIHRTTPSVPAAKPGTVSTQTNTTHGIVAMTAGHGFATNNVIDVFWSAGGRHGMTATVAGDNVTLDGGSGDSFPAVNTVVGAMVPTSVPFVIPVNTAVGIEVYSPVPGWIAFNDVSGEIAAATYRVSTAGYGKGWVTGDSAQPLNTATVSVKFTHGNVSAAQTMKAAVIN